MAESNFQDVVVLSSATLQVLGQAISVGSDAGAKSVILGNDVGALHIHASPTAIRSQLHPDANGTVGLITAISAGTTLASNGQLVLSNLNGVTFGINGNTITASVAGASAGIGAISAGTTLASSGTMVFSNSNGVSFGVSGNTVTASVSPSGGLAVAAGTQTATSGTVNFSNSNGFTFGMSGSSRVTATYEIGWAEIMAMIGV